MPFFCSNSKAHKNIKRRSGELAEKSFYGECLTLININCLLKHGWDIKEVTFEEVKDSLLRRTVPVFIIKRDDFLNLYISGDKLYYFSYPTEYWEKGTGRSGFFICRGDSLISEIVISLN